MVYGYARVSSKDQCEARQLMAFDRIHISKENVFVDKQSGKDFNRTNYRRLKRKLKEDDLLIVKSIDRLGRDLHRDTGRMADYNQDKKGGYKNTGHAPSGYHSE